MNNIEIETIVEAAQCNAGDVVTGWVIQSDEVRNILERVTQKHNEEKRQMIQDILKHRNVDGIYASDVKTVAESYGVDLSKTDVTTE